ncbi:hypothetical protein KVR01_013801 [Diaporthe batatas]|uniref:uncharacterized protein n=1 Tax=Diaporthe batatas TaxID=748121 RepID=UPI001D037DB3|nr:uncharacterized protein KVR01_013801 [Diaporthe batatas]KAG8156349.1 hypothetical protein KVR01_013801 [Diaporthe batatas]
MAALYSLLQVKPSDAEAIACGVDVPSMLNGPLFRTMFPTYSTLSPEERDKIVQWYIDGLEDALSDPGDEFYLKVCRRRGDQGTGSVTGDEHLRPLGFCGWEVIDHGRTRAMQTAEKTVDDSARPGEQAQKQQQQQEEEEEERQKDTEGQPLSTEVKAKKRRGNYLPETLDVDAWLTLSNKLRAERNRILQGRGNVCRLTFMAVHPDFQRRGIGSMMLQSICDESDRVPGRFAYVLAAPEGVRLYSSFGFEIVGKVETPHGNITSMLRPAPR